MTLFFHSCCGPCLGGVLHAVPNKSGIVAFWENPNIHPISEFRARLLSFRRFVELEKVPFVFGNTEYGLSFFLKNMGEELGEDRCKKCIRFRLEATAVRAKKEGAEAFSTTLLISPYQLHDEIRSLGNEIGRNIGVTFFYQDWRPNFKGTFTAAKQHDLYRQKYCGCIFSEWERFSKDEKFMKPIREAVLPSKG